MRDIRCDNVYKGDVGLGGWCSQLIVRVSEDLTGVIEYKCQRCGRVKTVRVDQPAYTMSTG